MSHKQGSPTSPSQPLGLGWPCLDAGRHQNRSVPALCYCTGTGNTRKSPGVKRRTGRDPAPSTGTGTTDPAWAQGGNLLPTTSQQHKEKAKKSLQHLPPTQRGSPGTGVTRALPHGGHWGSSNADPPTGDGAGAAHEALPALGALAGLPLAVPPLVFGQGRAAGEALPTLGTLVGPLPGVDAPVGDKGGVVFEVLPTVGAAEGPLIRVNALMFEEVGAPLKPLPTLRTLIGPLPGVGTLVYPQFGDPAEALPTIQALIGLFPGVDHLVLDQVGDAGEALPTFPTLLWPLPSVDPLLYPQIGAVAEALPTFQALVGLLPTVRLLPQLQAPPGSLAAFPAQGGSFLLGSLWPAFAAPPRVASPGLFLLCHPATPWE
ncbi:uncharacterized protein LOC116439031 [Corvus moneduloides]|uniref:uncharacterized protein LOC116439031 n=1 Tax=Corvus moneduloides TaxID=1196302 RepID=UPI0013622A72|nr:uncharacterized protein LOC116439031 [Corvus moneduloides]